MHKPSREDLQRMGVWIALTLALPALWLLFWGFAPSTRRYLTDSSWQRVVVFEPIVAWWFILLLKRAHHWFERELSLSSASAYRIARFLLWVNLLGIPTLVWCTVQIR